MTMQLDKLRDDDAQEMSEHEFAAERARIERLNVFAQSLALKRKEAVEGRAASGIEQQWREDEEFYDGIDDANRAAMVQKGATLNAGLTSEPARSATKSNVFVNITQPYVDMASARVADMLLPTDDMPFAIEPTPMPDIAAAVDDSTIFTSPAGQRASGGEIAQKILAEAKESAEAAQKRIWDWVAESGWHAEMRQVIEDAAKVGTGISKGPYPVKFKSRKITRAPDGSVQVEFIEKTKPGQKRISYWDFYPDSACGESIRNGKYTWERDRITARQLKDLKGTTHADGTPQYLDSEIDAVLKEGPQNKYITGEAEKSDSDRFEIWYFHGMADAEDLRAAGCECEDGEQIPVIVTLVNDRVIKAALNTLDSGEFPYDVMVWQRQPGKWAGKGVARQIRTPQRIVNAATRNMMDNAGLSAGPILFLRRSGLTPADGKWDLSPRKVFFIDEGTDIQQAQHAAFSVTIPSMQAELMNIINFGMELAEKVTNMPLLMQGQQEPNPETLGGTQIRNNNASVVLRRVAKIFDDNVTIPKIGRYYEWLLLYGEDPKEKGDFQIVAKGSTALFERDAQNQMIMQMGDLVKDPAFGIDPDKWMDETLRGMKLDPARFKFTEEQRKQQQEQAQANPPVDPRVAGQKEVAQIRSQADIEKAKLNQSSDMAELRFKAEEAMRERERQRDMKNMEFQIRMMEFAQEQKISLDKVKAQLAQTAIKVKAQKDLSTANGKGPQVASPPTEPAGRAEPGMAFQQ